MTWYSFDFDKINCLIDLHLHLDGALSLKTVRQLAELENIVIPEDDDELIQLIAIDEGCKDLNEYLEKFVFPTQLLSSFEAISIAVYNLCEELKEQGVIYAEIKIGPNVWNNEHLSSEEVVLAAIDGLNKSDLKAGLISCCMRGASYKDNMDTLILAKKYLGKGICGIDLAGAEALFPNEDYQYVYDYAKENNIPFTIHAGEASGPQSVYSALSFGTKRLGHGIRSYEDSKLLEILKEKDITLECCPTSNIDTSVFESLDEFPLRTYLDHQIKVTINSDDPTISRTSLRKEWKKVIEQFDLTKEEIKQMLKNSCEAAFINDDEKTELKEIIEENFEWI